ncbi:MAG: efflux RND transporter periplasmic adaptor subunit [Alphaproteobacteria bacterium]|nr:MAG: efflux RND transporter periplasmic adaptor subunit [Alphaproteobacteria bacterium]
MLRWGICLIFLSLPMAAWAEEITVQPVVVQDMKAVFGTVESVKTTPARARVEGTIESLALAEGAHVQAGQAIAKIYDAKLSLRLQALDARIRSLRADQDLARTELKRMQELRGGGTVSQAALDKAKSAYEQVSGGLDAAQAERGVIAQQNSESDVLAPASGRILKMLAVNGSVVRPGETVAEIATENYILRLRLPERHARFVKLGDTVKIGARGAQEDSADTAHRDGVIRLVYPELQQGRVIADVEADGLGDFFVGERAKVYLNTGSRMSLVVPRDYLVRRMGVTLLRVKAIGEVVVQPGQDMPGGIEILSGLKAGDILVKP